MTRRSTKIVTEEPVEDEGEVRAFSGLAVDVPEILDDDSPYVAPQTLDELFDWFEALESSIGNLYEHCIEATNNLATFCVASSGELAQISTQVNRLRVAHDQIRSSAHALATITARRRDAQDSDGLQDA